MRQNTNNVRLAGYVYQNGDGRNDFSKIQEAVTGPDSKTPNTKYLRGTISIALDQECLELVPVTFNYVTETTKAGKPNKTYALLKSLMDGELKTVFDNSVEEATKVTVLGSLDVNEYVDRDNNFVEYTRVRGSFINAVTSFPKKDSECNSFNVDVLLYNTRRVDPEEGESYLELSGFIFDYSNRASSAKFVVRDNDGIAYFEDQEISNSNLLYTGLNGKVSNMVTTSKTEQKTAWGTPIIKEFTNTRREFLVASSSEEPYEFPGEDTLTEAELQVCLAARETRKSEALARAKDKSSTPKAQPAFATTPVSSAPAQPAKKKWEF